MPQNLNRLATLLLLCVLVLGMSMVSAQDAESTPEATAEVTQEAPVVVVTDEPVVEVTAEPTEEVVPTAEVTDEPVIEPTVEATPDVSVPTEEPTETPLEVEPALSLLFYDSFDTADASNWLPAAGWFLADGSFQAANGAALISQPTFLPNPAQFYNVSAQARFKLNAGSVELSVRANGPVAYTASLDAAGTVSLVRAGQVVVSVPTAPVTLDNWTDVRISVYNSSVRVFVAGLPVIEWADAAPLPPGSVAITPVAPADGSGSILLAEDFVLWVPTAEFGNYPVVTEAPTQEVVPTAEVTEEPTLVPTAEVTEAPTEETPAVDPETGKSLVPFDVNAMPPMAADPPGNDNLADAATVVVATGPYVVTSTTAGATAVRENNGTPLNMSDDEITPAGCGFNIAYTVWFKFIPAENGSYDISTAGTAFDTILGLYTDADGLFPMDTLVACNDDVAGSQQARILNRALVGGTTYYIQLGGYNGNRGAYTFTVQRSNLPVPGAPGLVSPANKLLTGNNAGEVTFTWTAPTTGAGLAVDYLIEIDNDSNFSSPLFTPAERIVNGLTKSYTIPDGRWYWRVRARNINGVPGAPSARREFTQDNTAPAAPVLKTLADNSRTTATRPTLTWGKVAGANRYRVYLETAAGAMVLDGHPLASTSLALKPAVISAPLSQGCYEWRVEALDAAGNLGPLSDEFSFCVNLAKAPANGALVVDATLPATPKFTWAALGLSGVTYKIEIATDDDFTTLVHESPSNITALTYTVPNTETDLVAGTYYWRVVPNGIVPPEDIYFSFIVTPAAPPKVNLTAPASNAVLYNNMPTLDWTDVPAAATGGPFVYELQVSTTSNFAPGTFALETNTDAPVSTYTLSAPLADAKYFWRVRVRNSVNALGAWSTVRTFTIDTVAKQIAPLNASFTLDDTPTFKWDKVPGASAYKLLVDDDPAFGSPITLYTGPGVTYTIKAPASPLADGLWYWRVDFDFNDPDPFIESPLVWSFTVTPSLPGAPLITTPVNNGSVSDTRPQFSWSPVTGASAYLCQLSTDSRFRTFVWEDTVAGTTCTEPSEELAQGRYYARVLTYNGLGAPGKFSKTLVFFVDTTPPAAPVFTAPANGSSTSSRTPTITWRAATGAVKYDIRIGNELPLDDTDIPTTPTGNDITARSYRPAALDATTWYVQVRSIDAAGNESDWSSVLSFKITSAAGVAPIPNRTSDPTPQLSWTPISWATGYEVQIARANTFAAGTIVTGSDAIGINPTNWSPTTELAEGTYYWRVRAKKPDTTWGNWSSVGIFLVDY